MSGIIVLGYTVRYDPLGQRTAAKSLIPVSRIFEAGLLFVRKVEVAEPRVEPKNKS